MELTDILIDLSNSKAALEVANHTIRRMKGKCIRKNILIAGLLLQDGERGGKAAQGSR